MKITHFQATASWYTKRGCAGPVLASVVDRDPADYSHLPLMYPIILNSSGPGCNCGSTTPLRWWSCTTG